MATQSWQPIASVPKDTRVLLGKVGEESVVIAAVDANHPEFAWADDEGLTPVPNDATHWMQLPSPPEAE